MSKVLLSDLYTVKTGQWNGMISNVVNGEADISTAGLTICCKRNKVLDFFGSFSKESLGFVIKRKYVQGVPVFHDFWFQREFMKCWEHEFRGLFLL